MTIRITASSGLVRALRSRGLWLAVSAAVAAGSFITLRENFHSSCVFPAHDEWLFVVLPLVFAASAIWFMAEAVHVVLPAGQGVTHASVLPLSISLFLYASIGALVWVGDPTPKQPFDTPYRTYMSVLWSTGLLMETGNFDQYACGQ